MALSRRWWACRPGGVKKSSTARRRPAGAPDKPDERVSVSSVSPPFPELAEKNRASALSGQVGFISCRSEVVFTFILWEVTEEFADADPEGFDGSFGSLSQERLQFRKGHLDRVQVRRVAREETQ